MQAVIEEWLEGMLPVRQKRSSKRSFMVWILPEKSLMMVLMNWAENQLKTMPRKTGLLRSECNWIPALESIEFILPIEGVIFKAIYVKIVL